MASAHRGRFAMTGVTTLIAPAKLTWSLRITGVRPDGLHLIDAEMVTLELHDVVRGSGGDGGELTGPERASGPEDDSNLAARALHACGRTGHLGIEKRIPA